MYQSNLLSSNFFFFLGRCTNSVSDSMSDSPKVSSKNKSNKLLIIETNIILFNMKTKQLNEIFYQIWKNKMNYTFELIIKKYKQTNVKKGISCFKIKSDYIFAQKFTKR